MNLLTKRALILQAICMLLALAGGLIILGDVLSYEAWNGVNFVMVIYLILPLVACAGLAAALTRPASRRPLFTGIAGLSAFAITCVALIFLLGFIFGRDRNIPLNERVEMFGMSAPLLAFYGFSICSGSFLTLLAIFKYRQLKALR